MYQPNIGQFSFLNPANLVSIATQPQVISAGLQFYSQKQAQDQAKKAQQQQFIRDIKEQETQYLTEKGRLATDIEIAKLRAQAASSAVQQSGFFGLSQTKILVLGGLGAIAIMGAVVYLIRRKK